MVWVSGQRLQDDKYVIEKTLGLGGCGITYRACDNNGQVVVIKTLNDAVQQRSDFDKLQQDFLNEALRLAKCTHSHIVKIHEVFQEGRLWCMVMEYIEGEDLANYVTKRGVLPEDEALQYIGQIGEALAVVHKNGLLHRDIKPHNIILQKNTSGANFSLQAVLIDFGIAREFTPDLTQTHTENRTEYFAPIEQYERRAKRGAYTDVYALAATLYVILTGELPTPAPLRAVGTPLTPPKQYNSSISDKVNRAILKGMELKPENRPQSIQAWLGLLNLNSLPKNSGKTPNWVGKQPLKTALIGGTVLVLGVSGYIGYRIASVAANAAPRDLKVSLMKPNYKVNERIQIKEGRVCDDNGIGDINRVEIKLQKPGRGWELVASSLQRDFKLVLENKHCFSFTHDLQSLPAGRYKFQAIALDDSGNQIASEIKHFKVNAPPENFKIKTDKNNYAIAEPIKITGYVRDANGSNDISKVGFFLNEQLKGSLQFPLPTSKQDKNIAVINYSLNQVDAGNYELKAVVTDNSNIPIRSEILKIKVNGEPKDLTFKLTKDSYRIDEEVSIIDGKVYEENPEDIENVRFTLSKAANKVAEYDATNLEPSSQGGQWVKFKLSLGKLSPGSYTLSATAKDKSGKTTDSPPMEFQVVEK